MPKSLLQEIRIASGQSRIKHLLDTSASSMDLNDQTLRRGWTALHLAVLKDWPQVVKGLLIEKADTSLRSRELVRWRPGNWGALPAELAVSEERWECLKAFTKVDGLDPYNSGLASAVEALFLTNKWIKIPVSLVKGLASKVPADMVFTSTLFTLTYGSGHSNFVKSFKMGYSTDRLIHLAVALRDEDLLTGLIHNVSDIGNLRQLKDKRRHTLWDMVDIGEKTRGDSCPETVIKILLEAGVKPDRKYVLRKARKDEWKKITFIVENTLETDAYDARDLEMYNELLHLCARSNSPDATDAAKMLVHRGAHLITLSDIRPASGSSAPISSPLLIAISHKKWGLVKIFAKRVNYFDSTVKEHTELNEELKRQLDEAVSRIMSSTDLDSLSKYKLVSLLVSNGAHLKDHTVTSESILKLLPKYYLKLSKKAGVDVSTHNTGARTVLKVIYLRSEAAFLTYIRDVADSKVSQTKNQICSGEFLRSRDSIIHIDIDALKILFEFQVQPAKLDLFGIDLDQYIASVVKHILTLPNSSAVKLLDQLLTLAIENDQAYGLELLVKHASELSADTDFPIDGLLNSAFHIALHKGRLNHVAIIQKKEGVDQLDLMAALRFECKAFIENYLASNPLNSKRNSDNEYSYSETLLESLKIKALEKEWVTILNSTDTELSRREREQAATKPATFDPVPPDEPLSPSASQSKSGRLHSALNWGMSLFSSSKAEGEPATQQFEQDQVDSVYRALKGRFKEKEIVMLEKIAAIRRSILRLNATLLDIIDGNRSSLRSSPDTFARILKLKSNADSALSVADMMLKKNKGTRKDGKPDKSTALLSAQNVSTHAHSFIGFLCNYKNWHNNYTLELDTVLEQYKSVIVNVLEVMKLLSEQNLDPHSRDCIAQVMQFNANDVLPDQSESPPAFG